MQLLHSTVTGSALRILAQPPKINALFQNRNVRNLLIKLDAVSQKISLVIIFGCQVEGGIRHTPVSHT